MSETTFHDGSPALPPFSAPGAGAAALSADESYLAIGEADWFVARLLDPRSYEARMWSAATDQVKAACLRAATRKIDALRFVGVRRSETQALDWPRAWRREGAPIDASIEGGVGGDHLVADLPRAVRHACAIQAAHESASTMGRASDEEAAGRGVVSMGGPGGNQAFDLARATHAAARLCRDAQHLLDPYRFTEGDAL